MKRLFLVTVCLILLIGCAGMTRDIKKEISDELQPATLRTSFNTQPENLKSKSECSANDFFINIVNIETNTEDFNIVPRRQGTFKVSAKEISGHVAEYLKDAYRQCRINQSDNSKKIINISLKSLDGWYSFNSGATLKLNVFLPEKNQMLTFTAQQSAIDIQRAVAYAIHVISWDIVRDPTIQDYILCK